METFNQLLNHYVQRAGISDTELARASGVSRQTIFRWREGATGKPRHRDDVLVIARKLRLTPEERDKLLLAAGFRPEDIKIEDRVETTKKAAIEPGAIEEQAMAVVPQQSRRRIPPGYRWALGAALGLVLIGAAVWWGGGQLTDTLMTPTSSASPAIIPTIARPAPGETLILITAFANYAGAQVGYNVAGRLAQALQQEIDNTRLNHIRLEIWPVAVGERQQALQLGREVSATLVIYGEYDVGRVMVEFAHPADQNAFADPALQQQVTGVPELSAAINTNLPQQVRPLALLALGQIFLTQKQPDQARPLLAQARVYLKDEPKIDQTTWALVNFYLGLAYHDSQPPDLDAAIAAYNEAITAWPELLSSRLNRSAAYQVRAMPGDLNLALTDIDQIIRDKPDWPLAYTNRASLRLAMDGDQNMALAAFDLEEALSLDPALSAIYVNRAYLAYKRDKPMSSLVSDLNRALTLRPNDVSALNLYCWGYALEQQPEKALPYCQQAVTADPQPLYQDSRGVVYALTGQTTAALTDFEAFAAWLEKQPNPAWQPVLSRRRGWIAALKLGQNPLTPTILADLRHEFGK